VETLERLAGAVDLVVQVSFRPASASEVSSELQTKVEA
jgi:hypothetical protein